jgi:glucose/arabinose dehydrogenase
MPIRPAAMTVDPRGALIVADDVANTNWRINGPVRFSISVVA